MKKLQLKRRKKEVKLPPRITNETVAEHRERILAEGRRFKYPLQYSKHKLVINTIIISVVALILALVIGWQQLYIAQNTSNFFYRVTRIVPVPVATVDGEQVRYSDYLMRYRSSLHALESMKQLDRSTREGQRQAESIKELSLQSAVADAYARKLAQERSIDVESKRIDQFLEQSRAGLSEDAYDSVAKDLLNWTPEESRHMIYLTLLRQDVSFAIDEQALKTKQQVEKRIADDTSLEAIAKQLGDKVQYVDQGYVPKDNEDGGLTQAAVKLKKGNTSGAIRTAAGDGYYFATHVASDDEQINYQYIKIPLTVFDTQLEKLRKDDKVNRFISIQSRTEEN